MTSLESVAARLDRLPISPFHYVILIIAALSLLFDTLDSVLTGFVLASVRAAWHFPVSAIGIISAIGLAGFLVGAFSAGFLGDRYGRKAVIMYSLLLYSLFSVSRAFTNDPLTFTVINFFAWLFIGVESSIVPPYLSELWPSRNRGMLGGWMMSFFAYGIALTPLWALWIIAPLGWRWGLILTAPFAILAGFMRRYIPESPRWLARKGRAAEAEAVLTQIETIVQKQVKKELPQPAPAAIPSATPKIYSPADLVSPSYVRRTIALWLAWFAEYGVLYAFLTFVPTLLIVSGFSIIKSFTYSVIIYIAYIPGYILAGYIADLIDRKWTIALAFTMMAVFGTLFGVATNDTSVLVFGALTAFAAAMGSTGIYTYTPELYPTEIRATGMGIASAWGRAGSIVLLLVFGIFAVLKGKLFLFLVADVALVIAIIAIVSLGPATKNKSLELTSQGA